MDFLSMNFNLVENVFYFHNFDTKSLAFVLIWDTKEKFYLNLLNKSYADVIDRPNDHGMVLTRPEEPNYFHQKIPAFDIRYIEDCFKIKDFPDPTKYLIKNTSHSNYTKDDIFDCWLYQKKTWYDLISIPESKDNICKIEISSSFTNSIPQVTRSNEDTYDVGSSSSAMMATSVKKSNEDTYDVGSSSSAMMATSVKKSNEDTYDVGSSSSAMMATSVKKSNEDTYDVGLSSSTMMATSVKKSNEDTYDVGLSSSTMMATSVKKSNEDTYDVGLSSSTMMATSVKKSNEDTYDVGLSSSTMMATSVKKSNEDTYDVGLSSSTMMATSVKKSNEDTYDVGLSSSTMMATSVKKSNEDTYDVGLSSSTMMATSVKKSNEDTYDVGLSSSTMMATSVKKSNEDTYDVGLSSSTMMATSVKKSCRGVKNVVSSSYSKISSSSKNTKLPYTHKEEKNIVCYIIKNNYPLNVKGTTMWKQMERDNVCRHRTWQSMKGRYLKYIKPALNPKNDRFSFLTPNELKLLRQGLNIEPMNNDDKELLKNSFNEERLDNWSSDSS